MFHNNEIEAEWADKEIAKLKQLIEKEENEMREETHLSRVSNSIDKTQSPRNFPTSPSPSRPQQAHLPERLDPPQRIAKSKSSEMPDILGRWGNLEIYDRFNFEALQHALKQALTSDQRGDDGKYADHAESRAETGANEQESELEAAFLKDPDEENQDVDEIRDEDWEEYFDCEDKLSDKDYFFHNKTLQEGIPGYRHDQAEQSSGEDKPAFPAHLFINPLQALEDQENGDDIGPPNSTKSVKSPKKRSAQKPSRTWVTIFLAKKPKNRCRRIPRRPGRFVYPSSANVLFLLMNGINTDGARPTRGDTELLRHQRNRKSGQYVSFSSPLRHCWTYMSCEGKTG